MPFCYNGGMSNGPESTEPVSDEPLASLPGEVVCGAKRFRKAPYRSPEKDFLYSVRDKVNGERVIRIADVDSERNCVRVETFNDGKPSNQFAEVAIDALDRQAAKGWCSSLVPVGENEQAIDSAAGSSNSFDAVNVALRLDSQNFGRCCADIIRANIKYSTQLIKDVGDGPFRAGKYDQAFLTFEQLAVGFNAAVANSRRAIADGRRRLTAEKGKLSGKEIQERTAAFTRSEQLIQTAEREFASILEGLRMYLRAQQKSQGNVVDASDAASQ
jgi:hypothetical protein